MTLSLANDIFEFPLNFVEFKRGNGQCAITLDIRQRRVDKGTSWTRRSIRKSFVLRKRDRIESLAAVDKHPSEVNSSRLVIPGDK